MKEPKGYSYDPKNKNKPYRVQLTRGGISVYYEAFSSEEEATAAYKKASAEHPVLPRNGGRKPKYY
ncbi:hypothetical protein [Paenibacillus sp. Soil724D2]|uniref:hypothetical protein n=1 Tax=Paenibacillus sp. (strain Soil724D2) TaxID=1736392 RepID=UPI0007160975|nr:hypothetical protein [Paenibacillus sp. Soil724D2]KRE33267.1 hypothetical protein ASG85_13380 [Paenibacillus sp. Soil724D2]